jgi:hypothetical protein
VESISERGTLAVTSNLIVTASSLLVFAANVFHNALILSTLMMEMIPSFETSAPIIATTLRHKVIQCFSTVLKEGFRWEDPVCKPEINSRGDPLRWH